MKRRCYAEDCSAEIPRGFLMCPAHWRLVPAEVKHVWRESVADYLADRSRPAAEALIENQHELRRIVAAIEAGVPA